MHKRFAHLRLGKTEQFEDGDDLMQFIEKEKEKQWCYVI